jgi:hypothetical protein
MLTDITGFTLTCDHPHCRAKAPVVVWSYYDPTPLRERCAGAAREVGWQCDRSGDWCPEHSETNSEE